MCRTKGFTLLEILLVLSVIAILSSILWPVVARTRLDAHRATSTSNLRQCWLALRQYCDDHGGDEAMPTGEIAPQVLAGAPTCDSNDTWRSDCDDVFGVPLVGSYGYIRSTETFHARQTNRWQGTLKRKNPPLLVSIYYATKVPEPFHGSSPPLAPGNFLMPDRVLKLRLDGSVRLESQDVGRPWTSSSGGGMKVMTWDQVFL